MTPVSDDNFEIMSLSDIIYNMALSLNSNNYKYDWYAKSISINRWNVINYINNILTKEIVIKEPKPRGKDFNLTEEFLAYKREILEKLEQ